MAPVLALIIQALIEHSQVKPFDILFLTFYRADLNEAKGLFAAHNLSEVEANTVDAFQGREGKVVVLHCVSANEQGSPYGFICDTRRLCVSLSRAAQWLFVVGNVPLWQRRRERRRGPTNVEKYYEKFEEFLDLMIARRRYVNLPRSAIKEDFSARPIRH